MKLLRGFVQGVIEKQGKNSKYAVVAISAVSKSRNGFDEQTLYEFMVAGSDYTNGLHNAYRQNQGSEVFAPYTDEIDTFNGASRIRYSLNGIPVRLVDAPSVDQQRPAPAAVNQQQKATA